MCSSDHALSSSHTYYSYVASSSLSSSYSRVSAGYYSACSSSYFSSYSHSYDSCSYVSLDYSAPFYFS